MTTKPKRLHWMPLDWPAYWADTRAWFGRPDLHGAYMNLLGELWMRREPIPLDDKLAAVASCTREQWEAIKGEILPKFDIADGHLTQKRLGVEFTHAQAVSEARRAAGKKGAEKRWPKDGNGMANATDLPPDLLKQTHRQEQEHKQDSPNGESLSGDEAQAPAAPPPAPPAPPPEPPPPPPPAEPKAKKKHPGIDDYPAPFEELWAIYPPRSGGNPKKDAYEAYNARIENGATHEEIKAGLERYLRYCVHTEKLMTQYVLQASTFFGPSKRYLEPWHLPPTKAQATSRAATRAATMNHFGTRSQPAAQQQSEGESNGTDCEDPIDVQARVVPDAGA